MKSHSFENRVCLVTGASSGIGRQTALDLASAGARVCVTARREERLRSLVDEMGGEGVGHSSFVADVSARDSVKALASHVATTYGRLDVLVNNAGIGDGTPLRDPGGVEAVEKVMATNFLGAVYCTAELVPLLVEAAPSSVVNVASVAGRIAVGGAPAYCASKFALVGWSEALRSELLADGVYVSLVEPGLIPTEGFPQRAAQEDPLLRHLLAGVDEVSAAILDTVRRRAPERTVPRWYYLAQVPRLLAPRVYRFIDAKVVAPRRVGPVDR